MNIPLHPALVHLPLGLGFVMPLILMVLFLGERKGVWETSSWLVGVFMQLMVSLSAVVAMNLGEREEELVESFISENIIEHHEEWGEFFVWSSFGLLGLLILAHLLKRFPIVKIVSLIASVLFLVVIYETGHSGGELVYRYGAAQAFQKEASSISAPAKEVKEDVSQEYR